MKKNIKILAIESSCDETAAAVIGMENNQPIILSNIVSSQADLHAKTGGVVPEVASRAHMEAIIPVIAEALLTAKNSKLETRIFETNSNVQNSNVLKIEELENSDLFRASDIRISDLYSDAIEYLRQNIDYIAVTAGPGLIGSLLVGFNAAKSLAYALDKPIIPINHIEGHIYSAFSRVQEWMANPSTPLRAGATNHEKASINESTSQPINELTFPILALTVSGGHTSLTLMKDHGKYENIGQTLDDAAGEAFDKVAKLLDLGYPGGPIVSKLAQEHRNQKWTTNPSALLGAGATNHEKSETLSGSYGSLSISDRKAVVFPRPILNNGTFNFSFSGLKTAVLQHVLNIRKLNGDTENGDTENGDASPQRETSPTEAEKQEICAAFEDAAVDVLVTKTIRAAEKYKPKAIILAGGVAANKRLREVLGEEVKNYQLKTNNYQLNLLVPPINLCGDNAAMIGLAAYYHIKKGNISSWDKIKVDSNLELS